MKKTIIVDGLNLFARHYAAHPAMNSNGEQIGGIVGFFYAVIDKVEKFKPENTIIVWEAGGSKKKRDLYSDYKKKSRPQRLNRYYDDLPDTVQNRNFQLKLLISLFQNLPVKQIYVEDCEADDVIGYLCSYKIKEDIKLIMSSDHDYYQLINEKTRIWSPTLKKLVNVEKVIDRFNIHPNNFCLAKCIVGDPSDNIKGAKGVGFKNLVKHFPKFKDEQFYTQNAFFDDVRIKQQERDLKAFRSILDSKDVIKRNWRLVLLDMQNLSHVQLQKINCIIESDNEKIDKMGMMRLLLKNGIQNLNVNKAFLTFKLNRQNNGNNK